MARHYRRSILAGAGLVASAALLTACQAGDSHASGAVKANEAAAAKAAKAAPGSAAKPGGKGKGRGVSGTFAGGTVEYLAPGKYTVDVPGKTAQQFWVAEDTKVGGAGTICGAADAQSPAHCTLDQLEKATQRGAVNADVVMKDGIATRVTERRAPDEGPGGSDKGVSGTRTGTVTYLAPGKYLVDARGRTAQQFWVAEDTRISGTGQICGSPDARSAEKCSEAELEAATKGDGVTAEVELDNGVAVSITEGH